MEYQDKMTFLRFAGPNLATPDEVGYCSVYLKIDHGGTVHGRMISGYGDASPERAASGGDNDGGVLVWPG